MTTDPFTEAMFAASRENNPHRDPEYGEFRAGAEWARTHLATQGPTDAEVDALCRAVDEQAGYWLGPITASMVLQEARRAAREARHDVP